MREPRLISLPIGGIPFEVYYQPAEARLTSEQARKRLGIPRTRNWDHEVGKRMRELGWQGPRNFRINGKCERGYRWVDESPAPAA